jgi:glutamine cyclotransferase
MSIFGKAKRKCNSLKRNLNVIREERDALQRDEDKLVGLETAMYIMVYKDNVAFVLSTKKIEAVQKYQE